MLEALEPFSTRALERLRARLLLLEQLLLLLLRFLLLLKPLFLKVVSSQVGAEAVGVAEAGLQL